MCDWSSDVSSSDLNRFADQAIGVHGNRCATAAADRLDDQSGRPCAAGLNDAVGCNLDSAAIAGRAVSGANHERCIDRGADAADEAATAADRLDQHRVRAGPARSEVHTSELQSLMRI